MHELGARKNKVFGSRWKKKKERRQQQECSWAPLPQRTETRTGEAGRNDISDFLHLLGQGASMRLPDARLFIRVAPLGARRGLLRVLQS